MSTSISCDLVLLSWNHLDETSACVESLFETTQVPCRLFIVDNGSQPHVRAALAAIKPHGAIHEVTLLQNETNEGFPRGMNRGIRASTAPFVCLLNNDLRLTTGWLQEMLDVATANLTVGVLNPTSSTFGNVPPPGVSLQEHADRLRRFHGQYREVGMCIGFCLLIRREVLDRIGGLSEEVERIFFEDEDFCMRAQQAGFQCVVASASYVYHAEHQTVKKMPEREALFRRNQQWCQQRWGRWTRMVWASFEPVVPGSAALRQWLEELLRWTRRRTHVYVYRPIPPQVTPDALFHSVGLVPHADVHWYAIPRSPLAEWMALGLILRRQKKRFDIIVAPTPQWARRIARLGWLHRATVVPADQEEQLTLLWKRVSHSPL